MARTNHPFKVYNEGGVFEAQAKHAEVAAAIVALLGGVIKYGSSRIIVWREGSETVSASESYDEAAEIMWSRIIAKYPNKADAS